MAGYGVLDEAKKPKRKRNGKNRHVHSLSESLLLQVFNSSFLYSSLVLECSLNVAIIIRKSIKSWSVRQTRKSASRIRDEGNEQKTKRSTVYTQKTRKRALLQSQEQSCSGLEDLSLCC